MVIGIGSIVLRIPGNCSLKGKRKIVKSVVGKIRNTFNASAAEIADNDVLQRAEIGFALVGNDRRYINSKLDKVFNMVDDIHVAEIIDSKAEIISL
ncbi:MAG: DUF503 domain-containing protein [Pseudomonadota bacterium]|jgi:uncharacterized protein YlxP (DUF503 family)